MAECCQDASLRTWTHLKGPVSHREISRAYYFPMWRRARAQPYCDINDKKNAKACEILHSDFREEKDLTAHKMSIRVWCQIWVMGVKSVLSSRWDASFGAPPHRSKPASCPELSLDSEKSVRCCNKAGKGLFWGSSVYFKSQHSRREDLTFSSLFFCRRAWKAF